MTLQCDRCFRDSPILVPWTRALDGKRVLMKCCLVCAADMEAAAREAVTAANLANQQEWDAQPERGLT